jgi:hypothetical protein
MPPLRFSILVGEICTQHGVPLPGPRARKRLLAGAVVCE